MLIKIFILTLLSSTIAFSKTNITWKDCSGRSCKEDIRYGNHSLKNQITLKSNKFDLPRCVKNNNCWIFIGEIADVEERPIRRLNGLIRVFSFQLLKACL